MVRPTTSRAPGQPNDLSCHSACITRNTSEIPADDAPSNQREKASNGDLALLIDRINTEAGLKQIYGSQLRGKVEGGYELFPIDDQIILINVAQKWDSTRSLAILRVGV